MFLTLTYSDANLPPGGNLVPDDLTKFLKRLRKTYSPDENGLTLRYFACGEYGSQTDRPHYHVLVLNQDLNDKRPIKSGSKYTLYESSVLSKLWPFGHHALGDVTFESAAYVARYCMKKKNNGKKKLSLQRTAEFKSTSLCLGVPVSARNTSKPTKTS